MTDKENLINSTLYLSKHTRKKHKWLAKIKAKWTLWLDPDTGFFDSNRPDYKDIEQVIKRNTTIFIYEEDDSISNCKYVGRLADGKLKIGWGNLRNAVEDTDFEILEFTEKCKRLYLKEVEK